MNAVRAVNAAKAVIDELRIIDGVFLDEVFIVRGIHGYPVFQSYNAISLRNFAKLIHEDEGFSLVIDNERKIHIPVEENSRIQYELNLIASVIENN